MTFSSPLNCYDCFCISFSSLHLFCVSSLSEVPSSVFNFVFVNRDIEYAICRDPAARSSTLLSARRKCTKRFMDSELKLCGDCPYLYVNQTVGILLLSRWLILIIGLTENNVPRSR